MLYLPISRNWIVSRIAVRTYFICALTALSLFGVIIASRLALGSAGFGSFESSSTAALFVRCLVWPGILGTAMLCIAMWYFWFNFDDSGVLRRTVWFILLYLAIPIGPAFYYFFVYRRHSAVKACL
jgi:hypothetical protein